LLARDFDGKVDLTTLLHTSGILLKIGYQFMVFDQHGAFIDEAKFSDIHMEEQK
jgi:deoxycytidine triphosphate deaminase